MASASRSFPNQSYLGSVPPLGPALASLAAALAWSWAWWGLSIASGGTETVPGAVAWLVGGFGPAIVVVFTLTRQAADYRRSFRRRFLNWRIAWGWWLAAAAFATGPKLIAMSVAALGGHVASGDAMSLAALPIALAFGTLVVAIEEPLWRGVALDRFGPAVTKASLVIGVAWSAWHVPLFAVGGTFQHELGLGTLDFWVFSLGIVGLSVVMTWFVVGSGSILLAMFTHLMINLTGEFLPDDTTIRLIEMCLIWSVAAAVFVYRLRAWEASQHAAATGKIEVPLHEQALLG
jgi:membrane protease YdiL (CAAX protease family)